MFLKKILTLSALSLAAACSLQLLRAGPIPSTPSQKREPLPLAKRVDNAISSAADFLLASAKEKTFWENQKKWEGVAHVGGESSLALYALLRAGRSFDDPRLRASSPELAPAVAYIVALKPETNYVAAAKTLALTQIQNKNEFRAELAECREIMLQSMVSSDSNSRITPRAIPTTNSSATSSISGSGGAGGGQTLSIPTGGAFTYSPAYHQKNPHAWDNSNTQFAQRALRNLVDAKIEIPDTFWKNAEAHWRTSQLKDGGWPYEPANTGGGGEKSTRPMTAAALASLCDSIDYQLAQPAPAYLYPPKSPDKTFAAALSRFTTDFQPDSPDFFYLWSAQRAINATGQRFINNHDALRKITENLLERQRDDGSWKSSFSDGGLSGENPTVATSYALLILAAARDPVLFAKLNYTPDASQWNAHPRDLARLIPNLPRTSTRIAAWEIVDDSQPASALLDAPVLILAGSKDPTLTDKQIRLLRDYIEAGGLILSYPVSSSGGGGGATDGKAFSDAINKLAPAVFNNKYPLQSLPESHPFREGKLPPFTAISNGIRILWIHCPQDLGAAWQAGPLPQNADEFALASALEDYLAGRAGLRSRLKPLLPDPVGSTLRTIKIARVDAGPNTDPEPGAWRRLAALAAADYRTRLETLPRKPDALNPRETPLAHLTGTGPLKLTDPETAALKSFVDNGGLLLVDAAGGDADFAASFSTLAAKLWPDSPLTPLLPNDPLYNGVIKDSQKITTVTYRKNPASDIKRGSAPQLQSISKNGRHALLFSTDDLTAGALGLEHLGITGYSTTDSAKIFRNILLYSAAKTIPAAPPHAKTLVPLNP